MFIETNGQLLVRIPAVARAALAVSLALMAGPVLPQSPRPPVGASDYIYLVRIPPFGAHPAALQTGFRLRGTQGILTALHGVANGTIVSALNDKNQVVNNLTVQSADIENDVALLTPRDGTVLQSDGLPASQQAVGADAFLRVLGHPLGIDLHMKAVQAGNPALVVLRHLIPPAAATAFAERRSPSEEIEVIDIESPLVAGDSGAPVLDSAGGVVGIVDGGLLGGQAAISWAIALRSVHLRPVTDLQPQLTMLSGRPSEGLFAFEADAPPRVEIESVVWQMNDPNAKQGIIRGRVTGPNGQPLPGAEVDVYWFTGHSDDTFSHSLGRVFTKESGEYGFKIPAGGYHITIHKESYETKQALYLPVYPGSELRLDDTLRLESQGIRLFATSNGSADDPSDPHTAVLGGKITDYSGTAIPGAFVTATDSIEIPESWRGRTVKTNATGKFSIIGLPGSKLYDLTIEARGFRTYHITGVPTMAGYELDVNPRISLLRPH